MTGDIRIGEPPPPSPPARSGRLIAVAAGLILVAALAAWLMGAFRDPSTVTTTPSTLPPTTTTPGATSTTSVLADRLHRARAFWTALAAGDAAAAVATVPHPDPGAADLIAFVAAFSPGLTVQQCREFDEDTIECLVTVTDGELLALGAANRGVPVDGGHGPRPAAERLRVSDDGWFDVPAVVANAAARLSLYALNLHTKDVRDACPLTEAPQVPGLAIVGSPTGPCGAYLTRLLPEYLETGGSTTTSTTTEPPGTTTTTTLSVRYDRAALDYFREIAGAAEFGENGGILHRWSQDLRLVVYGSPTPADRAALDAVVADLNGLISLIEVAVVEADPNVEMHFAPVDEFPALEPNYVPGNMGYVYVWWDGTGSIYSARVLISTTGLTPEERAHLIREELTQGLGLLNDSWSYPDSIFYQGWTETRRYAPIDRQVIEMLYRPELAAGMEIDEALAILAGLAG